LQSLIVINNWHKFCHLCWWKLHYKLELLPHSVSRKRYLRKTTFVRLFFSWKILGNNLLYKLHRGLYLHHVWYSCKTNMFISWYFRKALDKTSCKNSFYLAIKPHLLTFFVFYIHWSDWTNQRIMFRGFMYHSWSSYSVI